MSSADKQAVLEHFDRLSSSGDWSRLYAVADGFTYHFHVRRARILELLPKRPGQVADLGCGPGVMVEAVRERGGNFTGIDYSPEMVREASERFHGVPEVSFLQGDIEALSLADGAYDTVICMAVLEYLEIPDKALREIHRILKPGGVALITVPKRRHVDRTMVSLTAPFRGIARMMGLGSADRLPRLCLQPDELDAAARRAGLEWEAGAQYHFTPLPYPLPRLAPGICMRLNAPFERWHATRAPLPSFLAHGYIGRYRKPSSGSGAS